MADQFTSLVDSVGGLCLDGGATKPTASGSNFSNPTHQPLAEALRTLIQSCEATSPHAAHVENVMESTHTPPSQGTVNRLVSLRRRATALESAAKAFSDATEHYILAYILSLAGPGTRVRKLLSHFIDDIMSIVREALDSTSDGGDVLREALEMCYAQAVDTSGVLHSDNYFVTLGEAYLAWPYDPDSESDDYYEHENRLDVDDVDAAAFRARYERRAEEKQQQGEEWIRLWVRALGKCPGGPTLFYRPSCRLADVPRYLFRTFDSESSGRSDHRVVASAQSLATTSQRSRVDLLLRTKNEIAEMLHGHLTKTCFGGHDVADNLMSWSSSLLFVIQYAIWRCHSLHRDPTEVEICMIDTRKFPRGQFARDKSLLRACRDAPNLDEETRRFFRFRLDHADYDNGEYLSQGVLHHAGRSSVVSLAQLIGAGLHDLYPEFADPSAMGLWTNRVKSLRSQWSVEHTTTQLDIQRALEMARACFEGFDAPDVALLLLSFKSRKLRALASQKIFPFGSGRRRKLDGFGPVEVQRYTVIAKTMMSEGEVCLHALSWPASDSQLLEGIYECSE
ncbi:hypothetical protein P168DRAFT_127848 [Aspergillus campestris IBT 28561]|uniref:DUF7587 domain-containing protein n=1 Tax=Aspergillus campestris (strain IBT 28561) TaxID=1392248 RepID=A0A2I1D6Y9_ASPC2|nr:uncharacterized protein P168DRAFT_127848 [Aspergillus campestris IBT 28561]PKY05641.1 hypothetical protein P168DRAFT_127848 [Aspergillus campestris IBT 28561]